MIQLRLQTSWGELRLVGGSRAGEGSLLLLPQLRLALDAGRPARALVPMRHVVVSHGHLDHSLGLAAWASQRQLQGIGGGTALVPAQLAASLAQLLALHAELESVRRYDVELIPIAPPQVFPFRQNLALRFFATTHRVPTLGVCVEWVRRHLRPALAAATPEELRDRRAAGESITEETRTPLLAYLADTGPGVFQEQPWLGDVEVLALECTFLRDADHERARQFGHIHLDDLIELAPGLRNRHLVLGHLSRRHRLAAGARTIRAALAHRLAGSLHLFNVEWL